MSPRCRDPFLAGERIVGPHQPVKSAQKGVKKRPLFGTLFGTPILDPSGHPRMAHEDPKGPQADISILYVLNQNIQFRSGPVLGSNSDLPSGLGPLVGTYPWRVDSGVPGSHLHCRPVTQYVWLRTLNPPRGVWPCAEGVGTCSEPVRTSEIGVFGDPQNGTPGGHNGTPK